MRSDTGELTVNQNVLVDEDDYTVIVKVTDANGFGLSSTCSLNFTVGVDPVSSAYMSWLYSY